MKNFKITFQIETADDVTSIVVGRIISKIEEVAYGELGKIGVTSVLCEGGLRLATSLAAAGLVDEWVTVLASKVIGSRRIGEAVCIRRTECLQD